jgi:hypothetical protein
MQEAGASLSMQLLAQLRRAGWFETTRPCFRRSGGVTIMASRFVNVCARMRGFNVRSKESRLRQKPYPGMAVASKKALYFVVDVQNLPTAAEGALGQFGAVGGLVAGMIKGKKKFKGPLLPRPDPPVEEMDISDLPEGVTGHPDWPVDFKNGWVLVVPREAVQSLRTSCLLGGIRVELRDVFILVFTPLFRRKQMAGLLVDMGWDVEGV